MQLAYEVGYLSPNDSLTTSTIDLIHDLVIWATSETAFLKILPLSIPEVQ